MARILLADDDTALRDLIARGLENDGHEIVVAADGAEALEQIKTGGAFDLLISDVEMPGLDGIGLCESALQAQNALKIILVSGFAEQLQRAEAVIGANGRTLLKPFSLDDLRAQVSAAIG